MTQNCHLDREDWEVLHGGGVYLFKLSHGLVVWTDGETLQGNFPSWLQ